jgi:hypothetical protein
MVPPKMMSLFDGQEHDQSVHVALLFVLVTRSTKQVEAHAVTALPFSSSAGTARSCETSEEPGPGNPGLGLIMV